MPGCEVERSPCKQFEHTCHGMDRAVIATCNYPHLFDGNINCIWELVTEKGTFVTLEFLDFNVPSSSHDCQRHGVTIYDGTLEENVMRGKVMHEYCGDKNPDGAVIRSSFHIMTVEFITNDWMEDRGRGFLAEYQALTFQSKVLEISPVNNMSKFNIG